MSALPQNKGSLSSTGLSPETIERIQAVFAAHPAVEEAILYGSRAKGTHKRGSDIDLTLRGEGLTDSMLHQIEQNLDDLLLPYKIDLSLHNHIDNHNLIDHINRVGRTLYAR